MGEIKQIEISSLKPVIVASFPLIIASLSLEYQEFL
jgi:hypothetical protein